MESAGNGAAGVAGVFGSLLLLLVLLRGRSGNSSTMLELLAEAVPGGAADFLVACVVACVCVCVCCGLMLLLQAQAARFVSFLLAGSRLRSCSSAHTDQTRLYLHVRAPNACDD